eukprot:m.65671 g.65671  ORF g.65671 m.65671 type:complete len:376 (+) comp13682_c1_seq1:1665-2792(+)
MAIRLGLVLLAVLCYQTQQATARVSVGAIRWDAWYGAPADKNYGVVGRTVTYDLGPSKYHYRVPFFGKEINATAVDVNGNTEATMTQEIELAKKYGIDYWAFCAYPIGCKDYSPPSSDCKNIQCCADNYALSYALELYLQNPNNKMVNFSLILQGGSWFPTSTLGGNETLEQEVDRYISYFRMPNHHKVLGGRPLVFVFGRGQVTQQLEYLRNRTIAAMGVDPYIVNMGGGDVGQDAVSRYVTAGGSPSGAPYEKAIAIPEAAGWDDARKAGKKVIPCISAGWDPRPRIDYPCPWGKPGPNYVVDPTMPELYNHTVEALRWTQRYGDAAEANAVIISAWNEHDEGHWIAPALEQYGGDQKLTTVGAAILAAQDKS